MKKNQTGFALIEGLLLLLIAVVIGGIGYYVYNSQKQTDKSLDSATTVSDDNAVVKKSGFVSINEWGVALRIGQASNADKLAYQIHKNSVGGDAAYFELKDATPSPCKPVGVVLTRSTKAVNEKYIQVGDAYYLPTYIDPGNCEDANLKPLLSSISESMNKLDYELKATN